MPANNNPIFVLTPRITSTEVTTSTLRDGSGTLNQLFLPGTNGSRVERINCILATTASTPGNTTMAVRIFIADYDGSNPRIFRENLIAAVGPSGTILGGNTQFTFAGGLIIGTNSSIWCGQSTGDTTHNKGHWTCEAGDF